MVVRVDSGFGSRSPRIGVNRQAPTAIVFIRPDNDKYARFGERLLLPRLRFTEVDYEDAPFSEVSLRIAYSLVIWLGQPKALFEKWYLIPESCVSVS
jgi:hypothetical protein